MGRSALEKTNIVPGHVDTDNLDNRLSTLLEAIEAERIPTRLLELAEELQRELSLRKQRRTPN